MSEKEELYDKVRATRFTSSENLISLTVVVFTMFFHLVFTMAFHLVR